MNTTVITMQKIANEWADRIQEAAKKEFWTEDDWPYRVGARFAVKKLREIAEELDTNG